MMYLKCLLGGLVLGCFFFGCDDQHTTESEEAAKGEDSLFAFSLDEKHLFLGENMGDTLHFRVPLDWMPVDSVACTVVGDTLQPPFVLDALYDEGKCHYAAVFSDCGILPVYDKSVVLSFFRGDGSSPFYVSEEIRISKGFFTGLPVVLIDTPGGVDVTSKEDWMEDVRLAIHDGQGQLDYEGEIEIKGRGNSTWGYPKKPFALKLGKRNRILGMPEHKRWVLLANYIDKTLMRNHIAFFLSRVEGVSLDWTPRGRFVDVVFNGQHVGNYYLCEQIKIDENRVDVHENTAEDIDGGYLIELDQYYDEVNKFRSPVMDLPVMVKEPDEKDLTSAQFAFLKEHIGEMEEALYADDFATSRIYADYMDVQTFVDYYIVCGLAGNAETFWPKSFYMHKDTGGKWKAGPVWDFDYASFGPFYWYFRQMPSKWWFGRLFQDPAVVQLYKERWMALRPAFEKVFEEIENTRMLIRKSAEANAMLWPIEGNDINKDERLSFDEAVDLLRDNLKGQMDWMDENL